MPWAKADVAKHKKGLTDKQENAWVKIANSARAECIAKGGTEEYCDGYAIRVANARAEKATEGGGMPDYELWLSEQPEEVQAMIGANVQGLKSALGKERDARKAAERAMREVSKTVDGKSYPASDFLVVEDLEKPSTWHLQVKRNGKPDHNLMGGAWAALHKGYRGNIYEGPDKAKAITKLKALYKAEDMELPEAAKPIEMLGDVVPLIEKAVRNDSTIPVKLIQPGWGSSGYYPAEVLARDGPRVFKAKTKAYWDHPTAAEEAARPEGSLRNLAAELTTDAAYREDGPAGPGLYADAKVFKPFQAAVDDLASHIGVSIRAMGTVEDGEAEGRRGNIVTALTGGRSVDFVTTAGAGGKILELYEAARGSNKQEVNTVTEEEAKQLRDANEKLVQEAAELTKRAQRAEEVLLLGEAKTIVGDALAKAKDELPDVTRVRLAQRLAQNPPVTKDGKLDNEKLQTAIDEAVKGEIAYLAEIAKSGLIRGMGASEAAASKTALKDAFAEQFIREGKSKEQAEKLAEIAAQGR